MDRAARPHGTTSWWKRLTTSKLALVIAAVLELFQGGGW
jgi:hypothetical protein